MVQKRHADHQQLADMLQREIGKEYGFVDETIQGALRMQYMRLWLVTDGFKALRGMHVLDLGCGSRNTPDNQTSQQRLYEPWLGRVADKAGAHVTGIDIAPNVGEHFHSVIGDLTDPATLNQFGDNSFDLVNSAALLVAPSRMKEENGGIDVTSPQLIQRPNAELDAIDEHISKNVLRILKPGHYFMKNERIYRKEASPDGTFHFQEVPFSEFMAKYGTPLLPKQ